MAHRHMKLELGRANPRKGIHKWDFPCSVVAVQDATIVSKHKQEANFLQRER
jgi:hypothetical protein